MKEKIEALSTPKLFSFSNLFFQKSAIKRWELKGEKAVMMKTVYKSKRDMESNGRGVE